MSRPAPLDPPRLAEWLLGRVVPPGLVGRTMRGDLREDFAERLRRAGPGRARTWYWREALALAARYAASRLATRIARLFRRPAAWGGAAKPSERRPHVMQSTWVDLRYAVRSLAKEPIYSLVALATVTLGIGANTAIFSVVKGVLLSDLPYAEPNRLVHIWENNVGESIPHYQVSPGDYADYAAQNNSFEGIGGYARWSLTYVGDGDAQRLQVTAVTPNMFEVMGVPAQLGRTLLPEDGPTNRVVLSHGFWQREFGGDSGVVERVISLEGTDATVVGVMPPEFELPTPPAELWFPLEYPVTNQRFARGFHVWYLVGRLRSGVTVDRARADLLRIAQGLEQDYPETNTGHLVTVTPLREAVVGDVSTPLLTLMAAVGLVLLIVCSNVANMTLSRSIGRSREFALRSALGATRSRLIRQSLTESVLLALLGGGLGLALALKGVDVLVMLSPLALPTVGDVAVDDSVLLFALVISTLVGVLSGIVPAWSASTQDLAPALKASARTASRGMSHRRLQHGFTITQMALAVTLLIGAGLMLRSYDRLRSVDPGFNPERLFAARVTLPSARYQNAEQTLRFWDQLEQRLEGHPAVTGAAQAQSLPMSGGFSSGLTVDGVDVSNGGVQPSVIYRNVSPDYFGMMSIPMIRGQAIAERHTSAAPRVVVINEAMARRFWPNADPIGARIKLGPDPTSLPWVEVIGVVSDVRETGFRTEPQPTVYLPSAQDAPRTQWIIVQTEGSSPGIGTAIRGTVRDIDPALPVYDVQPLRDVLASSIAQDRSSTLLLSIFACMALFIAAIGVYGVIAYSVSQRTHEIGIRMTLGADSGKIVALVVRQGMALALIAAAIGAGVSVAVTRLLESSLFAVSALDPVTFAVMPASLLVVAAVACCAPALRGWIPPTRCGPNDGL